jgi:hypothetical protein
MICRNRSQRINTLITIPEEAPVGFRDTSSKNSISSDSISSSNTCDHVESKRNWLVEQVSSIFVTVTCRSKLVAKKNTQPWISMPRFFSVAFSLSHFSLRSSKVIIV